MSGSRSALRCYKGNRSFAGHAYRSEGFVRGTSRTHTGVISSGVPPPAPLWHFSKHNPCRLSVSGGWVRAGVAVCFLTGGCGARVCEECRYQNNNARGFRRQGPLRRQSGVEKNTKAAATPALQIESQPACRVSRSHRGRPPFELLVPTTDRDGPTRRRLTSEQLGDRLTLLQDGDRAAGAVVVEVVDVDAKAVIDRR